MKRKIIALLLIAIMALTVFSAVAVTTTQKVEAKSTSPTSVVVPYYKSGTKYIYKPSEFNKYDYATYRIIEGSKPFIFQYAVWGNAFSSMRVSSEQQFNSYAYVGIVAQLDHMNQTDYFNNFQTLLSQPCRVTMHLSYHLEAKGDTVAKVRAVAASGSFAAPFWQAVALGNVTGQPHVQNGEKTVTFQSTVADVFRWTPSSNFGVEIVASTYPTPEHTAGSATAFCQLDYIIIEFPAS